MGKYKLKNPQYGYEDLYSGGLNSCYHADGTNEGIYFIFFVLCSQTGGAAAMYIHDQLGI